VPASALAELEELTLADGELLVRVIERHVKLGHYSVFLHQRVAVA